MSVSIPPRITAHRLLEEFLRIKEAIKNFANKMHWHEEDFDIICLRYSVINRYFYLRYKINDGNCYIKYYFIDLDRFKNGDMEAALLLAAHSKYYTNIEDIKKDILIIDGGYTENDYVSGLNCIDGGLCDD